MHSVTQSIQRVEIIGVFWFYEGVIYGFLVQNDPVNWVDPGGLFVLNPVTGGTIGSVLGPLGTAVGVVAGGLALAVGIEAIVDKMHNDRPENQNNPEDTADSISKAQDKLKKRDKDKSNWDPYDDWGDIPRPGGCPIDSTKKSTRKNWKKYY